MNKRNRFILVVVVVVVAGWHWIVPQKHWIVLITIPQTPVPQNVHRYCFGVIIGPRARASSNVRPTTVSLRASTSAS